jgi:hypothetical protein
MLFAHAPNRLLLVAAALVLLTIPASAQKKLTGAFCGGACDSRITCTEKVPGGLRRNESVFLFRRQVSFDGSFFNTLAGTSLNASSVTGTTDGAEDGQTLTVMICVGQNSSTIPARACTSFFDFTYHDVGACSNGGDLGDTCHGPFCHLK